MNGSEFIDLQTSAWTLHDAADAGDIEITGNFDERNHAQLYWHNACFWMDPITFALLVFGQWRNEKTW